VNWRESGGKKGEWREREGKEWTGHELEDRLLPQPVYSPPSLALPLVLPLPSVPDAHTPALAHASDSPVASPIIRSHLHCHIITNSATLYLNPTVLLSHCRVAERSIFWILFIPKCTSHPPCGATNSLVPG
jgi:hypothetical protein